MTVVHLAMRCYAGGVGVYAARAAYRTSANGRAVLAGQIQ